MSLQVRITHTFVCDYEHCAQVKQVAMKYTPDSPYMKVHAPPGWTTMVSGGMDSHYCDEHEFYLKQKPTTGLLKEGD